MNKSVALHAIQQKTRDFDKTSWLTEQKNCLVIWGLYTIYIYRGETYHC